MRYNFGSIDGLIEHLDGLAKQKREWASTASTKAVKSEFMLEASVYDYVVLLLNHSDLKDGRILFLDYELEDAKSEVTGAVTRVDEAILALENVKVELQAVQQKMDEEAVNVGT